MCDCINEILWNITNFLGFIKVVRWSLVFVTYYWRKVTDINERYTSRTHTFIKCLFLKQILVEKAITNDWHDFESETELLLLLLRQCLQDAFPYETYCVTHAKCISHLYWNTKKTHLLHTFFNIYAVSPLFSSCMFIGHTVRTVFTYFDTTYNVGALH